MTPDDPRHGTFNGYGNLKCRCKFCREANRLRLQMIRTGLARRQLDPDDPRHGKLSTYTNWRCRCSRCTAANTAQSAKQRAVR